MIILYNFGFSHFSISCTGLKDRSFHFGFNSHSPEVVQLASHEYQLPTIMQPWLDLNFYNLGSGVPKRIGIPTIEDGNVYGPSEIAIYNWLFFGEKSYATIIPTGPVSALDSLFHAPTRLARAFTKRPIDKWYSPTGMGMIPIPWIADSAHCLDMIRWMLRVAFFNRSHPENLQALGLNPVPLDRTLPLSERRRLLETPIASQKANRLMTACYFIASGPGFNTISAPALFMWSANKLRANIIEANHSAGYQCNDGRVIEAAGVGVYAKNFGRTESERLTELQAQGSFSTFSSASSATGAGAEPIQRSHQFYNFVGGLHAREHVMSPIYRWEIYQYWLRQIVRFENQVPVDPQEYVYLTPEIFSQTSFYLLSYFGNRYPAQFKTGAFRQFYGDYYQHNAQENPNWLNEVDNRVRPGLLSRQIEEAKIVPQIKLPGTDNFNAELNKIKKNSDLSIKMDRLRAYLTSMIDQNLTSDDMRDIKFGILMTITQIIAEHVKFTRISGDFTLAETQYFLDEIRRLLKEQIDMQRS